MIKLSTFLVVFLLSAVVHGQRKYGDPSVQFTKGQYREDLRELVKLITKNHPQTYTFISKKEFKKLVREKSEAITDSTSIGQFLWLCEDVAAAVQCVHTFVWWPADFGLIPDSLLFPLDTWTDGHSLYVTAARNNADKIGAGAEILSINEVSCETLLQAMYDSSPSDGNMRSSKRSWVNSVFNTLCPMYFNYPNTYTLKILEDGKIKTIQPAPYKWQAPGEDQHNPCPDHLCFELVEKDQVGILTIQSFDYYEQDFAIFKSFVDSAFSVLNAQHVEQLIIDLRQNGGGDSKCGSYLIEHIASHPYCYWPLDTNATWQRDLHAIIQPNENRFKGVPYVLIDGGGLSTTGHVCSILKENQFAVLVGEELGSSYTCNDGSMFGSLPHTALQYRVPTITYSTCATSLKKDEGVMPDLEVLQTLRDLIEGTDAQMNYVLERIKGN
jgi:hypothetical protein